jgi:hypothetical protein
MTAVLIRHQWLAALALFVVLALAYVPSTMLRATRGASITGDEPFYLLTTQSLIEDGNLDLRAQYVAQSYRSFFDHERPLWLQSREGPDGQILSPHGPGLSIYLIPGFALGGLRGAQVQMLLTAAAVYALAFVLVARETRAALLAWVATAVVALTATPFVYSTEIYPEVPAALCVVLSLLVFRRPAMSLRSATVIALLVTALAWLGPKYLPLGAVIAFATIWRAQAQTRIYFAVFCAVSGTAYVGWHLAAFGGLTPYSASAAYSDVPTADIVRSHLVPERAYRLVGLFVDQRFGLGRWAPILLPGLLALPLLLRRGPTGVVVAALVGAQLTIATFVALTMMGWWFPGRMLVVVLPLMAWTAVEVLLRAPRWLAYALAALGAYSLFITVMLVRAAIAREVHVAVDPFALPSLLFQAPSFLFPDYRSWDTRTIVLHVLWSLVCLGALGYGVLSVARLGTRRRPRLVRLGRIAPEAPWQVR